MMTARDALDAAGTILLRATDAVPGESTATQAAWLTVSAVLGVIVTSCTLAVFGWKIARPHVKAFVLSVVAPLQATADATHHQVAVNGGKSKNPTIRDDVSGVRKEVRAVREEVAELRDEVAEVRGAQQAHESESGAYLGQVALVLKAHEIDIPLPSENEDQ